MALKVLADDGTEHVLSGAERCWYEFLREMNILFKSTLDEVEVITAGKKEAFDVLKVVFVLYFGALFEEEA